MHTNGQKEQKQQCILIKGLISQKTLHFEIETIEEKLKRELLPAILLDKMLYHLAILLLECENRKKQLTNISLKTVYVKANSDDPNVFILKEDQQNFENNSKSSAKMHIQFICKISQLGLKEINSKITIQQIIKQIGSRIFKKQKGEKFKINPKQKLEQLYHLKITKSIYQTGVAEIFIVETPYFIQCERKIIVVKWTKISQDEQEHYEYREVKLMELVSDCPNCTQLFGYSKYKLQSFFFMRYYDITLETLNNKLGQEIRVSLQQYIHLFLQIILAVKGLHEKQIIHRDLKPENIMFEYYLEDESIEKMKCVVIDFDRSLGQRGDQSLVLKSDYDGTIGFQPPEGTQEKYKFSYDVWQIGYIMLCVLLREKSKEYSKKSKPIQKDIYDKIMSPFIKKAEEKYPEVSKLILQLMNYIPEQRRTLEWAIDSLKSLQIK